MLNALADSPGDKRLGRRNGGAGRQDSGIVHPRVRGIVAGAEVEPRGVNSRLPGSQCLHSGHVLRSVEPSQLFPGGVTRSGDDRSVVAECSVRPQQIVGVSEAHRLHRVRVAQDMAGHSAVVEERGPAPQFRRPHIPLSHHGVLELPPEICACHALSRPFWSRP